MIDWEKNQLLPAIVQDKDTNEVLMLAYMNEEAYDLTKSTKIAHYFSRSKQRIWKKGETSGNIQKVENIFLDCDDDTILLKVKQIGVACHTGRKSCFYKNIDTQDVINPEIDTAQIYSVVDTLYHTILEKKNDNPKTSYTASLFKKGENTILKKVVEEAGELCFAVKDNSKDDIIYECADLVYHILVALAYQDVNPDRIKTELKKRFGISGIEEKNGRKTD